MSNETTIHELVPQSLPPAAPFEPVAPRRIHWLLAFPATIPAMLAPRRLGPHLTESSWLSAYVVHLLSVIVFVGGMYAQRNNTLSVQAMWREASVWNEIRRPFAGFVSLLFTEARRWDDWVALWI